MVTYDTRVLVVMLCFSFVIFKLSKIKIKDISFVLGLAAVFLLLNNFFVYLFSPEYGTAALLPSEYDDEGGLCGSGGTAFYCMYGSE